MKYILPAIALLLVLPLANASLSELFQNRVNDMNAQAGPYLSKASLALPVDIKIESTDTQESVVIQAKKDGIILLDEVKEPDIIAKGTYEQLSQFNKIYMSTDEFLATFGSLSLEGETLKGKLALKIANKIIAEKVAEARAREAARLAAENPNQGNYIAQPKEPNFFQKVWNLIVQAFSKILHLF